jgi:antirestriction protein
MSKTDTTPCIYVADLAAYNAGYLHGVWIECCPADADAWQQAIDEMLAASPVGEDAEEWAIHDTENWHGIDPGNYSLTESG